MTTPASSGPMRWRRDLACDGLAAFAAVRPDRYLPRKVEKAMTDAAGVGAEESHLCGSRAHTPIPSTWPAEDTWHVRPNGDRCCSFCGSLHPDDWLRLMKEAAKPESKTVIYRSDKGYKFYVQQEGVANASEGGIKFYTWHIPSEEWASEANALHRDVVAASAAKRAAQMKVLFGSAT